MNQFAVTYDQLDTVNYANLLSITYMSLEKNSSKLKLDILF